MKKNKNGFLLAEVVIVSAILITTLVALYAGFSKVFKAYDERADFYHTNSLYALRNVQDFLVDNMTLNSLLKNIKNISDINATNPTLYFKNSDSIETNTTLSDHEKQYVKKEMDEYNLEYIILTLDEKAYIEKVNQDNITNEFAYYLSGELDFSEEYEYIFLSKTKDGKCAYLRGV